MRDQCVGDGEPKIIVTMTLHVYRGGVLYKRKLPCIFFWSHNSYRVEQSRSICAQLAQSPRVVDEKRLIRASNVFSAYRNKSTSVFRVNNQIARGFEHPRPSLADALSEVNVRCRQPDMYGVKSQTERLVDVVSNPSIPSD